MSARRTTRYCAIALLLTCSVAFSIYAQPPSETLPLFPVRTLWTLPLNSALAVPPAYRGTEAYIALEGDRLYAYELRKGTQRWAVEMPVTVQPTVGDELLFVAGPDAIAALNPDDGAIQWSVPLPEQLGGPLVWERGWLIARTAGGMLLAYRAADGELIWRRDLGVPLHAPPVVAFARLFAPLDDQRIVALDVATGEPVWDRRLGGPPNEILALSGRLYVGSDDNFFYCVQADDGAILWRWRTGGDVVGAAAADEQRVYFASNDNLLRGLDRNNGAQRWKRQLPVRAVGGPTLVGNVVLVRALAPTLRAFGVRDGAPAGEIPSPGELAAAPHVIDTEPLPIVVFVTRDLAKGATMVAVTRSIEPAVAPMAPLPNPVQPPRPPGTQNQTPSETPAQTR